MPQFRISSADHNKPSLCLLQYPQRKCESWSWQWHHCQKQGFTYLLSPYHWNWLQSQFCLFLTSMLAICHIFISQSKRKHSSCTKHFQPLVYILSNLHLHVKSFMKINQLFTTLSEGICLTANAVYKSWKKKAHKKRTKCLRKWYHLMLDKKRWPRHIHQNKYTTFSL